MIMKRLIYLCIVTFAITAPTTAISRTLFPDISEKESEIVITLLCNDEGLSREEILAKIDRKVDRSTSFDQRQELASMAMSGRQMPSEDKAKLCED